MCRVVMKPLPAGRSGVRKTVDQCSRKYQTPYGTIIRTRDRRWLILSESRLPDFFTWFWNNINSTAAVCLSPYGSGLIIMVWDDGDIRLCSYKSIIETEHLVRRMESLNELNEIILAGQEIDGHLKQVATENGWTVRCIPTPEPRLLRHINALKPAPFVAYLIPLCCLILALSVVRNVDSPAIDEPEPEATKYQALEHALSQTPGRITPLLRLDFNYLQLLRNLVGWELTDVEYESDGVQYGLQKTFGNLASVTYFAGEQQMQSQISPEQIRLKKQIHLPVVYKKLELSKLPRHNLLVADLTDSLGLWLPQTKLMLQPELRQNGWTSQKVVIQFTNLFPADLLTLAGILDGLPVRLEHGKYRVNETELSGSILLTMYGVNG